MLSRRNLFTLGVFFITVVNPLTAFLDERYSELEYKYIDIDSCLYMRPKGDYRKDFMVKRDLYKRMIVDGFNPVLVFEDKITVVEMWKEMGLKCLRVTGA
mgnify:CR=1 FL=1